MPRGPVWAIVVAAGGGSRYGGPKQFEQLAGERVVDRAVAVASAACDGVVLVVPADRVDDRPSGVDHVVAGGTTRSESVRAGLSVVPADAAVVVVHDGARPLAGVDLFHRVVAAVREGAAGAVPGVPVSDTLKRVGDDGAILATVERTGLVAVQTPQAFAAEQLRSAHRAAGQATDDAGLVEAAGGRVVVVTGDRRNVKITEPGDLELVEGLVRGRLVTDIRVGHAYDVHRRSDDPARALVLGGVTFDGEPGLDGHSDADVVAHVCADALLAAAGLDDLGQHFPDTDDTYAGADSVDLLGRAARLVREAGWEPANVDCTVVCDRPKLAPARERMQAGLSRAVGAPVTVKGRTTEGVGALGRGEAIAAWAVALVVAP